MNELQIFNSEEFGQIRTTTIDGEPYFVGKDIAEALGYKAERNAIAAHVDDDDKLMHQISAAGQMRDFTFINESGVYSLVFGSKLPSAKRFKRWVTSEVLPSIRKHGGYIKGQEQMSGEELMARALDYAHSKIQEMENRITEMRPKEIFADAVTASTSSILVRDLAKLLKQNGINTGEKRLYKWLRDHGYICRNSTMPTQRAMEAGLFEIIERSIIRSDMSPLVKQTAKVTGKGQQFFINKFLQGGEI